MIVVVEGIDRVGKTTLVKKLVKAGFIDLKDEFLIDPLNIENFPDYSVGKCESFVAIAKKLHNEGKNVVIDRLHLTEIVYGKDKRGETNLQGCLAVDLELSNLGSCLCLVTPSDIELSNALAEEEQDARSDMFNFYYKLSSMKKVACDFTTIDQTADYLIHLANEYDFYFASPFFRPEQIEREERMIAHLRGLGFKVFSPKENCNLDPKATQESREQVFKENCDAIAKSKAVFAVTDGKDVGTIWEAGYAFGINKPIVYFAETLGNNQFNLMLAQSGVAVFLEQSEVTSAALYDALSGNSKKYRGDIE